MTKGKGDHDRKEGKSEGLPKCNANRGSDVADVNEQGVTVAAVRNNNDREDEKKAARKVASHFFVMVSSIVFEWKNVDK